MQNFPLGVGLPHEGQMIWLGSTGATFSPHSRQNFAFAGSGAPHLMHAAESVAETPVAGWFCAVC